MANLRVLTVEVQDSTTIVASFTANLTKLLSVDNVYIEAVNDGIPSPSVLDLIVKGNQITLSVNPLTPVEQYYIYFKSTNLVKFTSVNSDDHLIEDSNANKVMILGPTESNNASLNFFTDYLRNNIYDITNTDTLIYRIFEGLSQEYSKALYDIRQVKNENYLSVDIVDELKTRGAGPFDRLNQESAYEVVRVAKTPTNTSASMEFSYESIDLSVKSLLENLSSENIILSSTNLVNCLNINNLVITLDNANVMSLESLVFNYQSITPYTYPIAKFGYQILDAKYDKTSAFSYAAIASNQIKLSQNMLLDAGFSKDNIVSIAITYKYKDLGRIVDASSIVVNTVNKSVREVVAPLLNIFNLSNAPVVDLNGNPITLGGISFTNPQYIAAGYVHPAFATEVLFNLSSLPARAGEYAVDYSTGTVYVYGEDSFKTGTGSTPPLFTYNYIHNYIDNVDYVYDTSDSDFVALQNGSLVGNNCSISINYEQVLVPSIDYNANVHIEELSESIENRLLSSNCVKVKNSPVTNVFRIYNESTGEVYSLDRFNGNKVYFNSNIPPTLVSITNERVSLEQVLNELIFPTQTLENSSNINIFKIDLNNNSIASGTQDSLGSFTNTSAVFSNTSIFSKERWFDYTIDLSINLDKLNIGNYSIDYTNGIVYVAITDPSNFNVGSISYKFNSINTAKKNIISVDGIYNQINDVKTNTFNYNSFDVSSVLVSGLKPSDEICLNGNTIYPYQVYSNQVGTFEASSFVPGITNSIKFLRGVYEFEDYSNNKSPINFASAASFTGNSLNLGSISKKEYSVVQDDGTNLFATVNFPLSYLSSNITITANVMKLSTSTNVWSPAGTFVIGDVLKLVFHSGASVSVGDSVVITYTVSINNLSRVVVDYNKGDLFIDYTYLRDTILISYEYGENHIDFRNSNTVSEGDTYYISYKVGALRDSLANNFGKLINIPALDNLDVDLNRDRFRDAVSGALSSFLKGSTVPSLKSLVSSISHIQPEIKESAFDTWSLGSSILTPRSLETSGNFRLVNGKYGNGVMIDANGQSITFPSNSNLKTDGGTFESWIIPNWNGLDNNASLNVVVSSTSFNVKPTNIFIGAAEYHPTFNSDGSFDVSRFDRSNGTPNMNKDGVFVYYDKDTSGLFSRWYIAVVDSSNAPYSIVVNSDGSFHDAKITSTNSSGLSKITSTKRQIKFKAVNTSTKFSCTFLSDKEHFLLDVGAEKNNRISLYKDASGYFNLRVLDTNGAAYSLAADVSSWIAYEAHHVAASWALNTVNKRDELHLFIDGMEVPNVIKYGVSNGDYLHEKFRAIDDSEVLGISTNNIVSSIDLITTAGSNLVSSSLNFSQYGISTGSSIIINEPGFSTSGYVINNVNGNTLTLSTTMPSTITDGRFSANQTDFVIDNDLSIYANIAVSKLTQVYADSGTVSTNASSIVFGNSTYPNAQAGYVLTIGSINYTILSIIGSNITIDGSLPAGSVSFTIHTNVSQEIPGQRALRPSYELTTNSSGQNIIRVLNNVSVNDMLLIEKFGLNHKKVKTKHYLWGSSSVLKTTLPTPVSLNEVIITKALLETTAIHGAPTTFGGTTYTQTIGIESQPTDSYVGRTLDVSLSSPNVSQANPMTITIHGSLNGTSTNETLTFVSTAQTIRTSQKYTGISSIALSYYSASNSNNQGTVSVKESYPVNHNEGSAHYPVLRYSYQVSAGTTMTGDGYTVSDSNNFFSDALVGNYLSIVYPSLNVGTHKINAVSLDKFTLTLDGYVGAFSGGIYQVLNASDYNSGFQNGYFTFEDGYKPGTPFNFNSGTYEIDYYAYLSIPLKPFTSQAFIGTDIHGNRFLDGVIDELKTSSVMITDTRVGETVNTSEQSITKDFNSVKQLTTSKTTLLLCHFESLPLINSADIYTQNKNGLTLSNSSVNDLFTQSAIVKDKPIIIENDGILNASKQGTIEFWVSPLFDTHNDPNNRFYFDATGSITEEVVSDNNTTITTGSKVGTVLSVKLKNGDQSIDYFAGGKIEYTTTGAISESTTNSEHSVLTLQNEVLQVISIKIANDPTNTDYFNNGVIGKDKRTIYLGSSLPTLGLSIVVIYKAVNGGSNTINSQSIRLNKALPNQQTPVIITYIPSGLNGDRMSIFKDKSGYLNFTVVASNTNYTVRAPINWSRNTWHRVKATYSFNNGNKKDFLHLFIDGREYGNILFGTGLLFGDPHVFGSTFVGSNKIKADIAFKDPINDLFIGSEFTSNSPAFALIDNFRISNIARDAIILYNEARDPVYNTNIDIVFPLTTDLYTTYLMNFDSSFVKTTDFATLNNKSSENGYFSINIPDSFGIISSSDKVKQVLESLIKALKPASSKVYLTYSD
jgi:hypothetical protein